MRLSVDGRAWQLPGPIVGRVQRGAGARDDDAILVTDEVVAAAGFKALITTARGTPTLPAVVETHTTADLHDGHIVAVLPQPGGRALVRTLYRPESAHNFLFITDRCNSYCLMCSQPPKDRDDIGFHAALNREVVRLIEPEPGTIGITGGEPTLAGGGLLEVLEALVLRFPRIGIHMLSNARAFAWPSVAGRYARVSGPNLTVAVPIYSDDPVQHDHIVQARGAFDETVRGLMNLARWRIGVEVRVVIHALSLPRLHETAEFIARTFPFAGHVALMGLEPVGFGKTNWTSLFVDPGTEPYQAQLRRAAHRLVLHGMNVSLYNHQLCLLPRDLHGLAVRSISDWKNEYLPVCDGCAARDRCGGFFASAAATGRHSAHVRAI